LKKLLAVLCAGLVFLAGVASPAYASESEYAKTCRSGTLGAICVRIYFDPSTGVVRAHYALDPVNNNLFSASNIRLYYEVSSGGCPCQTLPGDSFATTTYAYEDITVNMRNISPNTYCWTLSATMDYRHSAGASSIGAFTAGRICA
jgi:hypothetical protein